MQKFFKMSAYRFSVLLFVMVSLFHRPVSGGAVQLDQNNINDVLKSSELVFVNFYADWCRFSQMLAPIFEQAAEKVAQEIGGKEKVTFGKVDCDKETAIAAQYHVSKYPTLKIFRFGQQVKREYRGQRSAEAFTKFIKEQTANPVKQAKSMEELESLDRKKRNIIAYLDSLDSPNMKVYSKLASTLREDCEFHSVHGEVAAEHRTTGDKIVFRPSEEHESDVAYLGDMSDWDGLHMWARDRCIPLVREITFENAEELTEEGLPFLILFHHPDDKETPKKFSSIISKELLAEKSSVNTLTADGLKFSHPLHHLGKTSKDLPLLAIDSFRHMYLWPHSAKDDLEKPGLLKQFIDDLHSGKLHREFHHGPDPTTTTTPAPAKHEDKENTDSETQPPHVPKEKETTENVEQKERKDPTSPPESTFKKLAPSSSRYTLLRDEL